MKARNDPTVIREITELPLVVHRRGARAMFTSEILGRFLDGFTAGGDESCWLWERNPNRNGYGRFSYVSETGERIWMYAHRAVWTFLRGPIPVDMELDHCCPNGPRKMCVRPSHLQLLGREENGTDGNMRRWHGANYREGGDRPMGMSAAAAARLEAMPT